MGSVYDIAFSFIEKNTKSPQLFCDVVDVFNKVLDMGFTESEIYKLMGNKIFDTAVSIMTMFRPQKTPLNLLKSNTFYYHNMLRCMSKPPRQEWDINAGTIIDICEPFYLEMQASFTMEELVKYYHKQLDLKYDSSTYNRYKGAFEFLIKKYGIDLTLFMIDSARDNVLSEDMIKPTTPVSIAEFEHDAKDRLNSKISETRCTGDDKIVFKQRVFSSRSWVQDINRVSEEFNNYA